MDAADLKRRTKTFAIAVIRYVEQLPHNPTGWVIAKQLLRSATGMGSNYRSACRARSKPDFISKIGIAEEEADESMYWLELIEEAGLADPVETRRLLQEADELTAILTASGRTAKAGLKPR